MRHTDLARALADRLAADLAAATDGIALVGSVAHGTDHPHSDIDLILAAESPAGVEIRQVEGRMVTLTRKSPDQWRAALTRPQEAGAAVAAWRSARLLHDPHGTLTALQAEAHAWTWARIGVEADRWAAAELVGLAEEVHKIHGMIALGRPRAAAVWAEAVTTVWAHPPVWFHGDIAAGNLLHADGRLSALIDFGTCGVGDPACDLVIAWTYFDRDERRLFREAAGLDDGTWRRARGWALWKALVTIARTGTDDVQTRALAAVLADPLT